MSTDRLTLADVASADTTRLMKALSIIGYDVTDMEIRDVRAAVAKMLYDNHGPYELCDENGEPFRWATIDEMIEFATTAWVDGYIMVDGKRCRVMEEEKFDKWHAHLLTQDEVDALPEGSQVRVWTRKPMGDQEWRGWVRYTITRDGETTLAVAADGSRWALKYVGRGVFDTIVATV